MQVFIAFVRWLIFMPYDQSKLNRVAFYCDPAGTLNDFRFNGSPLSEEQKAVIASLNYSAIGNYSRDAALKAEIEDFVDHNDNDDDWPDPGEAVWNPWDHARDCGPQGCPRNDASSFGDFRIFWAPPNAQVAWAFPQHAQTGSTIELRVVGAGWLPGAWIRLTEIARPHGRITAPTNDYIGCNIRRCYISATISLAGARPGRYTLSVWNKGWKRAKRDWWQSFVVDA